MSTLYQGYSGLTIADIKKKVAQTFKVEVEDLESECRARKFARPRQIAMYLSKLLTPRSYPEIGARFGGRDHSTVIHGCRLVEVLMEKDSNFKRQVDALHQELRSEHEFQYILPFVETKLYFSLASSTFFGGERSGKSAAPLVTDSQVGDLQLSFGFENCLRNVIVLKSKPAPRAVVSFTEGDINTMVAAYYDIELKELMSPSQDEYLQYCRNVAACLRERLQLRQQGKSTSDPRFSEADKLMRQDTDVIWQKLHSADRLCLI